MTGIIELSLWQATTLCAFLPMLFWPGAAGEFMGMLPVTLIFVPAALLVMALI